MMSCMTYRVPCSRTPSSWAMPPCAHVELSWRLSHLSSDQYHPGPVARPCTSWFTGLAHKFWSPCQFQVNSPSWPSLTRADLHFGLCPYRRAQTYSGFGPLHEVYLSSLPIALYHSVRELGFKVYCLHRLPWSSIWLLSIFFSLDQLSSSLRIAPMAYASFGY